MVSPDYGLIADIGGTHVRFATADPKTGVPDIASLQITGTKDHSDIAAAAQAYLSVRKLNQPPRAIVFAVAGPVTNGEITLTNAGWHIRESDLRADFKTHKAHLVNDFEALAMAVPVLAGNGSLKSLGGPAFDATRNGAIAIVGPGTGLGVGGAIHKDGEHIALVTEGGHAAFAPTDDLEIEILKFLTKEFGRVSNERLLSGPGIFNLYTAMCAAEGKQAADVTPEEITKTAREKPDSFEAKVFARFCAILGSVAGDVALMLGARGGVLIGGGILPDAAEIFAKSEFRARFEAKARFTDYMKAIPTVLIMDTHAGLVGAGAILADDVN
ncbi:MAG TPA: glucokinase [Rhizomicrobium sp.]|nr:glucokinase [Rhizomicrobium sp.]HWD49844.1 glucokinase [Rhizomicrobium sp.]